MGRDVREVEAAADPPVPLVTHVYSPQPPPPPSPPPVPINPPSIADLCLSLAHFLSPLLCCVRLAANLSSGSGLGNELFVGVPPSTVLAELEEEAGYKGAE